MSCSLPIRGVLTAALARRGALELGPALVFFAVFSWKGIIAATAAFMAAALTSLGVTYIERRALPTVPVISTALVGCFGGLTLLLGDAFYVKLHPTVANGFYGAVLAGAKLRGRNLLRRAFSGELHLDRQGWDKLAWRAVAYLGALALANEVVRRSASTETWVVFKVFVILLLNVAFLAAQYRLFRRHWEPPAEQ